MIEHTAIQGPLATRMRWWFALAVSVGVLPLAPMESATAGIMDNPNIPVSEKDHWSPVYQLAIPVNSLGWNSTAIPYTVNNSGSIPNGSFDRVAYYLELMKPDTSLDWVYVSFDTAGFTNIASRLGVPNSASGEFYQQTLANMNIYSNNPAIVTGTGIATGNIEFWPSNYGQANDKGVPNASSSLFDFGDGGAGTSGGHGSMQIHNYGAAQTLFAYNAWGAARTSELGIGNQGTGNPDWTFNTSNISNYTTRTLEIQVHVVPEPATLVMLGTGGIVLAACVWRRLRRERLRSRQR